MNRMIIIGLVLVTFGCASTPRGSAISLAYSSFEGGNYQDTLKYVSQAENEREISAELKAELTYLKAQTYEKMGHQNKADGLYEYLKEQHPTSQYGYLGSKMLNSSK